MVIKNHFMYNKSTGECKPTPMPKVKPNLGFKSGFLVNSDPDVYWICPKMLRIHYYVGISQFAKYGTNGPLIVWEMLINVQEIPYSAMVKKVIRNRPHTDLYHQQKLITSRGSLPADTC